MIGFAFHFYDQMIYKNDRSLQGKNDANAMGKADASTFVIARSQDADVAISGL